MICIREELLAQPESRSARGDKSMIWMDEANADLRLRCEGTLFSVREALQHVHQFLSIQCMPCALVEDVDLVLSEAMTNIVRHSYGDAGGVIECDLVVKGTSVDCRITDTGRSFDPAGAGRAPPEPADLAEGGYGWFLIHSLTNKLSYTREGGRNILRFSVPAMQAMAKDDAEVHVLS
ncbi:serine/threonine-protein kinase RsbW [Roseinatronobacter bogoriensis subsp. barguzinensis]|uniref:ATP-binding protein n=2 Tax=Roseinatronobacter bogoriensis TaxID=119542 RepID=A0A2K8KCL9_9RHOB|nr:ATP-binding protein [Rhodobaca barguzinensis]TDW41467.1 serine/threonine-protein kinase RsbW [Rhodobaca barguzinensis]TDY74355.1 serine/threonine-protein kinase RsbW [Rhodobaca bogoriensis DSM 18756]